MSVIVILIVPGDPVAAAAVFEAHRDEMTAIAQSGKAAGAIHHRVAAGINEIVIVDEWESREAWEAFSGDPQTAQLMLNAGAQTLVLDVIDTADSF